MKRQILLALSLFMSVHVFAGWLPSEETKDSIKYHGAQYVAGCATGLLTDLSIGALFDVLPIRFNSKQGRQIFGLIRILQFITILKVPDMLNQTTAMKSYADKEKTDTGRWAYFIGMFHRNFLLNMF